MDKRLMAISCDPDCGFMIKSHDEEEVVKVAKVHVKEKHSMNATDEDMKKRIKIM